MGCGCCSTLRDQLFTSTADFVPLASSEKEAAGEGSDVDSKDGAAKPSNGQSPGHAHRHGQLGGAGATVGTTGDEEKIELVFRSKRTNVFAQGYDTTSDVKVKVIPKTKRQAHIIRTSISQNFIFSSLSEEEIACIVDSMEVMHVCTDQVVITQGEDGDYFYIIESGLFTVLVNDVAVAKIGDGKSFGELALLNNSTRAATIRSDSDSTLFTLDRATFRYTLAKSSASKHKAVNEALSNVPLLKNLFDHQLAKIADAVEIVKYNYGDYIIRKGAEGNVFYMIKEGSVRVTDIGVKGGQFVDHTMNPGDYFGERALITGEPRAANVVADSKEGVTVMALDRMAFDSLLGPLKELIDNNMNLTMLRTIKLFKELTDDERTKVVRSFKLKTFPAGETIINEGDKGHEFFIMKSGSAKVLVHGKEVGELHAGTYFGEMALLDDEVRKATVVAAAATGSGSGHASGATTPSAGKGNMAAGGGGGGGGSGSGTSSMLTAAAAAVANVAAGVTGAPAVGGAAGGCECFVLDRTTFNRILGSLKDILAREVVGRKEQLDTAKAASTTSGPAGSPAAGGAANGKPKAPNPNAIKFIDLINIGLLGTGKFARVTLAQHRRSKTTYALKTMSKREIVLQKQQANIMHERIVLEAMDHPFILKLHATFQDQMKLYMLLEFVQGGELFSLIHAADHDGLPDSHGKFYSMCLVLIIEYLHSKDIVYRDLKPENVLIDRDGYPKLVDFGFAKVLKGSQKTFTLCGTPEYIAPEIVLGRGYNRGVDYWALGILIYEMIAGQSPFADVEGQDQAVICKNIIDGRTVFPTDFDPDCKDLVKRLLAKDVQARLGNLRGGIDEIKMHKWFSSMHKSSGGGDSSDYGAVNACSKALMAKQVKAPWIPTLKNSTDISNFDPYEEEASSQGSRSSAGSNHSAAAAAVMNPAHRPPTGAAAAGAGSKGKSGRNIDHGEWEREFPADKWSFSR